MDHLPRDRREQSALNYQPENTDRKKIMSQLSFDGFGINGPDKYRTRLATFTNDEAGKAYGKLFESAPEMLQALRDALEVLETAHRYFPKSIKNRDTFQLLNVEANSVRAAIAKATTTN